jgi:hypothetical protein
MENGSAQIGRGSFEDIHVRRICLVISLLILTLPQMMLSHL